MGDATHARAEMGFLWPARIFSSIKGWKQFAYTEFDAIGPANTASVVAVQFLADAALI